MFRDLLARGLVKFGQWFVERGIQLAGSGKAKIWFMTQPDRDASILISLSVIVMAPVVALTVISIWGGC